MNKPGEERPLGMVLTTSAIPPVDGHEVLGIVAGVSMLSRDIVRDFGAAVKNTLGGELKTYTALMETGFTKALERLGDRARDLGADGVFGIQIACPAITGGAAEVILIGTAYRIRR
jgi:uncharacterized protein YbjQ (UPF0145 family)